jgi:molecular chaperone DnaK (HSP70)
MRMKNIEHIFDRSSLSCSRGIWIGIDLGTSNCAVAVWDSHGGRSKWIRLNHHQLAEKEQSGKAGRTAPSALLFGQDGETGDEIISESDGVKVKVGHAAVNVLNVSLDDPDGSVSPYSPEDVSLALLTSFKRIFGMSSKDLQEDQAFLAQLPFSLDEVGGIIVGEDDAPRMRLRPLDSNDEIYVTPLQATAVLLRSLRLAAEDYLQNQAKKKNLQVPGAYEHSSFFHVRNCVVGVPAHYSQSQRHLMERACQLAGFNGHVSTLTESTAAILSYGLFVSAPGGRSKSILVFDIGAGTTDCSIAVMSSDDEDRQFKIVVTDGDNRLGGDDMDEAVLKIVVNKLAASYEILSARQRRALLRSCRQAKEHLCGGTDGEAPKTSSAVVFEGSRVQISQEEFNTAVESLVERAKMLVRGAVERFRVEHPKSQGIVDEVVLVGGATRVPAVRQMLQSLFPAVELCTSVNPDSACAQGLAIQAAIRSGLVPKHELRSALMLDALPHSIGVKKDDGSFICILPKDTSLPARGYATFTLADATQRGVTILAVEHVGDSLPLESLGEFTFLLHRLSQEVLDQLENGKRTIDVGFTMETSGQFVVSIFDPNDPDHVRKRQRYQQQKAKQEGLELGFHDISQEDKMPMEQIALIVASVLLFVLYLVVKLVFNEPQESATTI